MVQLIVGNKGKGKTLHLLNKANEEIKTSEGNIVFIDKNSKHMYDLNNRIRLIDMTEFAVHNADEFIGFLLGIISQDHDLDQLFLDNFLTISSLTKEDVLDALQRIVQISTQYDISVTISLSLTEAELPEDMKKHILLAL